MSDLLHRFSLTTTKWLGGAQATLDGFRSHWSHLVMETSGGRAGFALFGGFRARHQFQRLYLDTPEDTRTRLALHRPATADYCRGLARRYGLVVFCGDSAPPDLTSELLPVPLWVRLVMPTPAVFEGPGAPWNKSAKANIARIKRSRFDFDVVSDRDWVNEFHRRMFRPSMRGRHGNEAYVDSRRSLARLARAEGMELLRVLQDGRWVAGSMNQSTPDGYRLHKLGWLNGDEDLLVCGVVSALYWFNFKRAAALGHRHINFGTVAPYLEDGLFLYKSRWGGQLSGDGPSYGEFHLLLDPSHQMCRRFLQTHSIVSMGANRDFIVFSGTDPDGVVVSPEVRRGIKRWYTWRDRPLSVPEVTSEEVPRSLQPWLTAREG